MKFHFENDEIEQYLEEQKTIGADAYRNAVEKLDTFLSCFTFKHIDFMLDLFSLDEHMYFDFERILSEYVSSRKIFRDTLLRLGIQSAIVQSVVPK